MQKAVEPENDAGFPKHNYSQLNCSCYSYPSKPRVQYPSKPRLQCFFRLHIYGISKWLHTTATARVKARARTCTPRALVMYYAPISNQHRSLFRGEKSARTPELLEVGILRHNF